MASTQGRPAQTRGQQNPEAIVQATLAQPQRRPCLPNRARPMWMRRFLRAIASERHTTPRRQAYVRKALAGLQACGTRHYTHSSPAPRMMLVPTRTPPKDSSETLTVVTRPSTNSHRCTLTQAMNPKLRSSEPALETGGEHSQKHLAHPLPSGPRTSLRLHRPRTTPLRQATCPIASRVGVKRALI